jgi:hypothetical protein
MYQIQKNNHRLRGGAYYSNNISFFTKDSIVIRVRPEIVNMFETIVYMEVDASEMIQLDTIDSETLRKVIQFCEYQQRLLYRQADGDGFEDDQNEFAMFYFRDIDNDNDFMIKMLNAADFLGITILIRFLKQHIANSMSTYWNLLDQSKNGFVVGAFHTDQYISEQATIFGNLINYIPVLKVAARTR